MKISDLPLEIKEHICILTHPSLITSLTSCSSYFHRLFQDHRVRANWILANKETKEDALLFCYRKGFLQEAVYIVNTCVDPVLQLAEPFANIICQDTLNNQQLLPTKTEICKAIFEKSRMLHGKDDISPCIRDKFALSLKDIAVMALRWSVYFGEYQIVSYLLDELGLEITSINCYLNWWLRMLRSSQFDLIRILLRNGADVLGSVPTNADEPPILTTMSKDTSHLGQTHGRVLSKRNNVYPVRTMALEGRYEAVEFLLSETPLYRESKAALIEAAYYALLAASMTNNSIIISIVRKYCDNLREIDKDLDCLIMGCSRGSKEAVESLVQWINTGSSSPLSQDELHILLMRGVESDKVSIIPVLLDAGCIVSLNEEEALIMACELGNPKVVQLLIENGADVSMGDYSAVRLAAKNGHYDIVQLLISHSDTQIGTRSFKWKVMAKCKEIWRSSNSAREESLL